MIKTSFLVVLFDKQSYDSILRHVFCHSTVYHQLRYYEYCFQMPQVSSSLAFSLILASACIRTRPWCLLWCSLHPNDDLNKQRGLYALRGSKYLNQRYLEHCPAFSRDYSSIRCVCSCICFVPFSLVSFMVFTFSSARSYMRSPIFQKPFRSSLEAMESPLYHLQS